ncbi:MAG: type II toxin-antitoxin system VapB family antitoxin [Rhizobiaceae bacterium]
MGLNIKNDEVHRLAREVAARTGETMTHAIQTALEERLARLSADVAKDRADRAARVRAILDSIPHYPGATSNHDDLYDEFGLPK